MQEDKCGVNTHSVRASPEASLRLQNFRWCKTQYLVASNQYMGLTIEMPHLKSLPNVTAESEQNLIVVKTKSFLNYADTLLP